MAKNDYDIIVIGSGIGGLTSAAYLARRGLKVLVLEQAENPGGYCASFEKNGFTLDAAIHFYEGGQKDIRYQDSFFLSILKDLDIEDDIELVRFVELYTLSSPYGYITIKADFIDFLQHLCELFPHEKKGVFEFYKLILKLGHEIKEYLPLFDIPHLAIMPLRFPAIFKCHDKTLSQVLDAYMTNEHLKFIFSGMIYMFLGLPPSKLSALMGLSFFYFCHHEGLFYAKGGAHVVPNAMIEVIKKHGGEVRLKSRVTNIMVEKNRVKGVKTESGEEMTASRVVSNTDARQTFWEMIGEDKIPARLNRQLKTFETSVSFNQLWLCLDIDPREMKLHSSETIFFHSENLEEVYGDCLKNHFINSGSITIPTFLDSNLAPPGKHIAVVISPTGCQVPLQSSPQYPEYKKTMEEHLKGLLEKVTPGITRFVIDKEAATPLTFQRYTSNFRGAAYGWASTPSQSTYKGILPKTPIKGLYLAGHWTFPCGGAIAAMMSGRATARLIMRDQFF